MISTRIHTADEQDDSDGDYDSVDVKRYGDAARWMVSSPQSLAAADMYS